MFYCLADGHGLPHDPFKALITPRPIGWISTVDAEGRANLAPYSFFNGCGDSPPLVMFAQTGRKSRPEPVKDTIANVRATGEFACSTVSEALKEAMNATSGTQRPEVDEFELARPTKVPGIAIAAPHVAESPVVLECRAVKVIDDLPNRYEHTFNIVVIGDVVGVKIDDAALKDGRLDVLAFNQVARLGYMDYTTVTEVWEMNRPD